MLWLPLFDFLDRIARDFDKARIGVRIDNDLQQCDGLRVTNIAEHFHHRAADMEAWIGDDGNQIGNNIRPISIPSASIRTLRSFP